MSQLECVSHRILVRLMLDMTSLFSVMQASRRLPALLVPILVPVVAVVEVVLHVEGVGLVRVALAVEVVVLVGALGRRVALGPRAMTIRLLLVALVVVLAFLVSVGMSSREMSSRVEIVRSVKCPPTVEELPYEN